MYGVCDMFSVFGSSAEVGVVVYDWRAWSLPLVVCLWLPKPSMLALANTLAVYCVMA